MIVISRRVLVPHAGREETVISWARRFVAGMNRLGSQARAMKVLMGPDTGNIEVFARYSDFRHGVESFQTIGRDAEMVSLRAEHEAHPAASVHGPYVYRYVYGEASAKPVIVQRSYKVSRDKLQAALELLPEAKAAIGPQVSMTAAVPVFAPDMDHLIITYAVDDLNQLGEVLDQFAMAPAFQTVVAKAGALGNLSL
ncbi:MAG: hypothetical protein EBX62_02530, partial [Betaproteobacteria bacterium]|nr:hypothetical protein [Betaproteobacteria bacterium]